VVVPIILNNCLERQQHNYITHIQYLQATTILDIMHLSMVCPTCAPRMGAQVTPWEFGHFSFPEDNFPTLGPTFSVKFPSLLEAFLNDFSIIFQNGGKKWDRKQCQNPRQIPGGCPPSSWGIPLIGA